MREVMEKRLSDLENRMGTLEEQFNRTLEITTRTVASLNNLLEAELMFKKTALQELRNGFTNSQRGR